MKKLITLTLSCLLIFGCFAITAAAEESPVTADVIVTLSSKGDLVVTSETVTVQDRDNNGKLTIDETLFALHEAKYEGGANAGYVTSVTEWGLGIQKLWGDESGNFGYYLNNAAAWGLDDEVKSGDSLYAFIYKDSEYYSDMYCWFDKTTVTAKTGEEITLELKGAGYDADWNPIQVPVENAVITINGEETEFVTDKDGKVTVSVDTADLYVLSAVSKSQTLVPPVCKLTVEAAEDKVESEPSQDEDKTETETESKPSEEEDKTETTEKEEEKSPATSDNSNLALAFICTIVFAVAILTVARKKIYEN